jgi:hypothetical protein
LKKAFPGLVRVDPQPWPRPRLHPRLLPVAEAEALRMSGVT